MVSKGTSWTEKEGESPSPSWPGVLQGSGPGMCSYGKVLLDLQLQPVLQHGGHQCIKVVFGRGTLWHHPLEVHFLPAAEPLPRQGLTSNLPPHPVSDGHLSTAVQEWLLPTQKFHSARWVRIWFPYPNQASAEMPVGTVNKAGKDAFSFTFET